MVTAHAATMIMMTMIRINVLKLEHYDTSLPLPEYETSGAAGADLRACLLPNHSLEIRPKERVLIPTGLVFEIPKGYEVQVRPRSGLSYKTSLMVLNSPGTIDSDYRGEVKVILGNMGDLPYTIKHGDRIAQIVIAPVLRAVFDCVDQLEDTIRGDGGFGSTGGC